MARVILPTPLGLVRGKLDKDSDIYFFVRNGVQYCAKQKKKNLKLQTEPSEKQKEVKKNFKAAAVYVKEVMADPARKSYYEKHWKQNLRHFSTLRGYIVHCYYAEYLHE